MFSGHRWSLSLPPLGLVALPAIWSWCWYVFSHERPQAVSLFGACSGTMPLSTLSVNTSGGAWGGQARGQPHSSQLLRLPHLSCLLSLHPQSYAGHPDVLPSDSNCREVFHLPLIRLELCTDCGKIREMGVEGKEL